jgi:hypothetical protein
MTNTLHRYGSAESFYDDYIIFAIPSRGKNDKGSVPKLKQFLEMALPFKPVNLGDALNGGALRPRRDMSPTSHWNRDMTPDFRGVIDGLTGPTTVAAVFDDRVLERDVFAAGTPAARAAAAGAMVMRLPFNLGVGGAMRAGYRFGHERGFAAVVQVDADGQHDAVEIEHLLAVPDADIVIGSRFAGRGDYAVRGPRRWAMRQAKR